MGAPASRNALDQHPFVARLLQLVDLKAADLKGLDDIIYGELVIRKRRDLIADGYEYRKLCFVKDGYAVRYKLLRNGKRQILNVILPGDVVGLPGSFYERAVYSVSAISDLRMNVCSLDAYVQLCYRHPQYGLALTWIAVQEATTYAEHVIDVGRRTPIERLSHFLLELHDRLKTVGRAEKARFTLPFSQEVIADVLGLSVPHLNRMMQQLRAEKLIADRERVVEFLDAGAMQTLAHYQPQALAPIPPPA
ncbi:MAG TPA: Crp/Fnr family transcriptional regulator [Pseudolabrys sp.]|nr:Crp/Fnr family transcriptional regulator [Pseudolabrys sp.]